MNKPLPDYQALYNTMVVLPSREDDIAFIIKKIRGAQSRYAHVTEQTGVPWQMIAVIHYRESTLSFTHHLHNGDPLSARTVHVPVGRPSVGDPPFTWEESAIDALRFQGLARIKDWSLLSMLYRLEAYNGFGYFKRGLPSPYLWSFTTEYHAGKYTSDHGFDPKAIDDQCGCAPLLKELLK